MIITAVAALIMGCSSPKPEGALSPGMAIPSFSLQASDGKTYTSESLAKEGPVFLYFVKENCSANPYAIKHFNAIHKAYAGKVKFFGVINAGKDGWKSWSSNYGSKFPVLLDPDQKVISAFGLEKSQYTFELGKNGKIVKAFPGFGIQSLNGVNEEIAKSLKVSPANISFPDAPQRLAFG